MISNLFQNLISFSINTKYQFSLSVSKNCRSNWLSRHNKNTKAAQLREHTLTNTAVFCWKLKANWNIHFLQIPNTQQYYTSSYCCLCNATTNKGNFSNIFSYLRFMQIVFFFLLQLRCKRWQIAINKRNVLQTKTSFFFFENLQNIQHFPNIVYCDGGLVQVGKCKTFLH